MSNPQNMGRVLSVCVTITDPDASGWLWEAMLGIGKPMHGVQVMAIGDGNVFDELRECEDLRAGDGK